VKFHNKTDESPQEAQPAWENGNIGFIEAVHLHNDWKD